MVELGITRLRYTFLDRVGGGGFQITGPPQAGKEIDESGGRVDAVISEFGVTVIERKCVMIIVPTFAGRVQR